MANGSGQKVTMQDVERVLPLKSWWAMITVLPLLRPLTRLAVNHTGITPNAITATSIMCRLVTAASFYTATETGYVIGAIVYYVAYVLDCMDGAVARLRNMSSEFGRFLDHIGDLVGDFLILAVLAWSLGLLLTPMVLGMLYIHLAECYINYLAGTICRTTTTTSSPPNLFNHYRDWCFRRNTKSFFSFPDYTALIFVVFPLYGRPELGLKVGFPFLLAISLYTIFSTFVSIHTGRKQFP